VMARILFKIEPFLFSVEGRVFPFFGEVLHLLLCQRGVAEGRRWRMLLMKGLCGLGAFIERNTRWTMMAP
jgi:hypothetical protein